MSDKFTKEEWATCIKVLEVLKDDPFDNPDNQTFKSLFTKIYKKVKKQNRTSDKAEHLAEDVALLKKSAIAQTALQHETKQKSVEVVTTTRLNKPRNCYSCYAPYQEVHFFYHRLCPSCARLNYQARDCSVDLNGYNVILTGGRVKVGYATALFLLRNGANLMVTTRFPGLAYEQFTKEPDFEQWKNRLSLYGLDLRNLEQTHAFIAHYKTKYDSLDILVNNAAQTIKYTPEYYQPLIAKEQQCLLQGTQVSLIENTTPVHQEEMPLLAGNTFSEVPLNRFGQPIDEREKNSWNSKLEEIGLQELVEVNLINHIAPYYLISGLKSWFMKSENFHKSIVNVTSVEGQFSYSNKNEFHPHTNMTKAALNMLTRTSAADFAKDDIYMNSVDVGWISTGAHEEKRKRLFDKAKVPPLDSIDGAARIMQPIQLACMETPVYGKLFKNYVEVDW